MPTVFESTVVTCGPLVPTTNPTIIPLGFDGGLVRVIRIIIPDGHAGLTGIALGYGGNNVLPTTRVGYYSGDGREIVFDYIDQQQGVTWQAFLCNGDTQAHSWEVNFDLDTISDTPTPSVLTPLTPNAILAAGTAALAGA
jgi:hypothetical protein